MSLLRRVGTRLYSTVKMTHTPVLRHLSKAIETLTPLQLADHRWDNVGLLLEAPIPRSIPEREQSILLCIDLTSEVLKEAIAGPTTSVILCYHPIIFSALKSLTLSNSLQKSLLGCAAHGISVFCIHTAADSSKGGINDFLAGIFTNAGIDKVQLKDVKIEAIQKAVNPPPGHEGAGVGRLVDMGTNNSGLTKSEVVAALKSGLNRQYLQAAWSSSGKENISTIAICAGSGSDVLRGIKADLWFTGELAHHDVLAANAAGTHVILSNHSASERPWLPSFATRLQEEMNRHANAESSQEFFYKAIVSQSDKEPLDVV